MTQHEIRTKITDTVVQSLRYGTTPFWRRPWSDSENSGLPANAFSRRNYRGINTWLLQIFAQERNYRSRYFATFNQWKAKGFTVTKRPAEVQAGTFGCKIVLYKPVTKTRINDDGEEMTTNFCILREFFVFSAEQVTGPGIEKYLAHPKTPPTFIDCEQAERVISATGAVIRHGGNRACYHLVDDCIQLPPKAAFTKPHEYYNVAGHELCHWTGHEYRLNRLDTLARFGSESYAMEELIAELGAAFLSAELSIPQSGDLENVAAYLGDWLKVLEGDVSAIFLASSAASRAVDYILGFSKKQEESEEAHAVGGSA